MEVNTKLEGILGRTSFWARSLARLVFSTSGRLNRLQFAFGCGLAMIVAWIGPDQRNSGLAFMLAYGLALAYVCFVVYSKRIHDLGMSATLPSLIGIALTLAKIFAIPYFVLIDFWSERIIYTKTAWAIYYSWIAFFLIMTLYLLIAKGQSGVNRYGVQPGHGIVQAPVGDFGQG